jgi:phosphoribosylformylglycinamidine synthase
VLGVLGLVPAVQAPPPGLAWSEGDTLVLVGPRRAPDGSTPLEGTRWATERRDHRTGEVAAVDFDAHAAVCGFVAALVAAQVAGAAGDTLVHAVHDVSGGGLAVALAEMAAAAETGCTVELHDAGELFTELPSRFVVATAAPEELCAWAVAHGVPAAVLGTARGGRVTVGTLLDLPVEALSEAHDGNLALALGES